VPHLAALFNAFVCSSSGQQFFKSDSIFNLPFSFHQVFKVETLHKHINSFTHARTPPTLLQSKKPPTPKHEEALPTRMGYGLIEGKKQ
jgi:hypothetical protein